MSANRHRGTAAPALVAFDRRILRFPLGGTVQFAQELLRAMTASTPDGLELVPVDGWPRLDPLESSLPRPIRRLANAASDAGWHRAAAAVEARRRGVAAWLAPANSTPRGLPCPAVTVIHDLNVLRSPDAYSATYARLAAAELRHTASAASHIVVPSHAVERDVVERLGVEGWRVSVVPEGADHILGPGWQRPHAPQPYVLFVGQTEPHKNIELLIETWRRPGAVPDDLHLVICGPAGRADGRLRAQASDLGLERRLSFIGLVSDDRLRALFDHAMAVVLPSTAEGFGLPPLEGMVRGTPAIVADAGPLPEVTGGAAVCFDPADPEALGRAITRVATDQAFRDDLIERGRTVAARYRWEETARQTWEVIGRVLH